MTQKTPICEVCCDKEKKYKCPKCNILYCSLPCFKSHQVSACAARQEDFAIHSILPSTSTNHTESRERKDEPDSEDRVPPEALEALRDNENLKTLLNNNHLRDYLLKLDTAFNPDQAMERAMTEPIFLEFADECLKTVEMSKENKKKLDL